MPWRRKSEPDSAERGRQGERLAARFLKRRGYKVLYRNFRPGRGGEIDLVCRHGEVLVFVEVKTRSRDDFGSPVETLGMIQKVSIARGALAWLRMLDNPDILFRFDVVEVRHANADWGCHLIENAFTLPEGYRYSPEKDWRLRSLENKR